MAGRPSKVIDICEGHRTKEEIAQRKEAEAALLTGVHMEMWPDVKSNAKARAEFERVKELLAFIGKDDALQEGCVNRYCLLFAECYDFEKKRETFTRSMAELKREYKADKMDTGQYFVLVTNMQKNIINLDKQIQSKRNMMLAIEKENLMTIASALRSVPKKVEKKEKKTGVAAFMAKRADTG